MLEYAPVKPFTPRWYQVEAMQAVFGYFYDGNKGNPLVEVPTGGGKSHIIAMLTATILHRWPEQRVLVITHTSKIVAQNADTMQQHISADRVGIFCSGLGRKQCREVTFATIQSIHRKPYLFDTITFIVVDEAHKIPIKQVGTYRRFLDHFPSIPVVGFTATPYRLDGGLLYG